MLRVHLSGLFYFELLIDIEIFEKMQVYAETNGQDFEEQSVYYQHGQADTADQQYIRQGDFGYPGEIRQVVSDMMLSVNPPLRLQAVIDGDDCRKRAKIIESAGILAFPRHLLVLKFSKNIKDLEVLA